VAASGRWSRRRLASLRGYEEPSGSSPRIICVVPLYLEQDIAADTVRFWQNLARLGQFDQVVLVTTAKEKPGRGSTSDIVAAELATLGRGERIRHVHCQEIARFRAAQLDLAVQQALQDDRTAGRPQSLTWVAVYNADSRPAGTAFAELARQARAAPSTRVFQQLAEYVVPQRAPVGITAAGNAVLQTWWTRSHYFARSVSGARHNSWWSAVTPYSTFGHGEFVRLDFLEDIGGFPDFAYADGLLLGWICRLRAEPIGLLASRDCAEVPRTAADLMTQQTAWMRGLLNFGATVAWCRRNGHLRLTRREVAALRCAHAAIPLAWGLSTAALAAGAAQTAAALARRPAGKGDLLRLAGLLAYPVLPALLMPGRPAAWRARGAGALASWPVEGLAFWPALASHLRGQQHAPAKTPR
jgi:hypothetical protein